MEIEQDRKIKAGSIDVNMQINSMYLSEVHYLIMKTEKGVWGREGKLKDARSVDPSFFYG